MKETAIVIGGGMGGLFTAALLAKKGLKVTVLEKNKNIGGGLQSFKKHGKIFDAGLHVVAGMHKGGSLHKICCYLGILDSLKLEDCSDNLTYFSSGKTYHIPNGREAFVDVLASEFPHERRGLEEYVEALYAVTREFDLYYLRPSDDFFTSVSETAMMPADEFIAQYICDERLRDILAYMNPMYAGVAGQTPAYVHALLNVVFLNGRQRFVGGASQLANALAKVITDAGGCVKAKTEVTRILMHDKKIAAVETADGKCYTADVYISDVHPRHLISLIDGKGLSKAYTERVNAMPVGYSAFMLFITLKEGIIPYDNINHYYQDDYGLAWQRVDSRSWPNALMMMTPPEENQGRWASKIYAAATMSYEQVSRWADTRRKHRGDDYEQWKRRHIELMLSKMERLYPQLRDAIDEVVAGSPLTIRDYFNTPEGSMYGNIKDCNNFALSMLPVITKVPNLLLTGQNVNLHGICGVPLTAVSTAEVVVGHNTIIEEINNKYNNLYGNN